MSMIKCEKCGATLQVRRRVIFKDKTTMLGKPYYKCECLAVYDQDGKFTGREDESLHE